VPGRGPVGSAPAGVDVVANMRLLPKYNERMSADVKNWPDSDML